MVSRTPRQDRRRQELSALYATLVGRERAVFYLLRRNGDVPVASLYGSFEIAPRPHRQMQMFIGNIATRLNRKLAPLGYRIRPGLRRGTYRLYDTHGE